MSVLVSWPLKVFFSVVLAFWVNSLTSFGSVCHLDSDSSSSLAEFGKNSSMAVF